MDEERDVWVGNEVVCLAGGGVGCHDYSGGGCERCGWEVGVVHEGDMWELVGACCQVQLGFM